MSKELVAVLLLAFAGFLIGGAYASWKTTKALATIAGLGAVLAIGGAITWLAG